MIFSPIRLSSLDSQEIFVCPSNSTSCIYTVPYRSSLYINITDSSGMHTYEPDVISFFYGQALVGGKQGDYLDPTQTYYSSQPSGNSYTGAIYQCTGEMIVEKPAVYPSGIFIKDLGNFLKIRFSRDMFKF